MKRFLRIFWLADEGQKSEEDTSAGKHLKDKSTVLYLCSLDYSLTRDYCVVPGLTGNVVVHHIFEWE